MDIKSNYRQMLRVGRMKKELTQQEVADKVGISRSYYSDIENGKAVPSGRTLFNINEVIPIFLTNNDADRKNKKKGG